MKLTKAQRNAVDYDGNTLIVACPGSGKTRTLVGKLLKCVELVKGSSRRVACITYTNAGVYEIENRLKVHGRVGDEDYCDVSTIHSFCLNNILQFFHWMIPEYKDSFTVLPSDANHYHEIVTAVCNDHNLNRSTSIDGFEQLNRQPDGKPISETIPMEVALDFWKRLSKEGYIDYPNIVYYSYYLLKNRPSIAHTLACKYAWVLVDEFQDTSALQVEILKVIAEFNKTKFFLVGDPYQSIFSFAGARPDLMDDFAKFIKAKDKFSLTDNFRSSLLIVDHAETICSRSPSMCAIGPTSDYTVEPKYIHTPTAFEGIRDYYLPALNDLNIDYGQSAILAPWWIKLLIVGRNLREYGVPIVGPGARPYKRSHLFAPLAENICAYIEHPNAKILHHIEKDLFNLIYLLEGGTNYRIFSYWGRVIIYRLIFCGKRLRDKYEGGILWLKMAAEEFTKIMVDAELFSNKWYEVLNESVSSMEADMIKNKIDTANLSVADLGMFASTESNMKLLTMHGAKGREFDAVAIIDIHEGKVPHYQATTINKIEEGRRLFYVAITRAKKLLMYITDDEDRRNKPSRFLKNEGLNLLPSNLD